MNTYRWDAPAYDSHASNQRRWARELIEKLAFEGGERVLDLGCGDGKIASELSALLPEGSVLGVDVSDHMVEHARETYPPSLHPNLRFEKADARKLPYEDEFDVVFSTSVLHWIQEHGPVLTGIRRCLRSGGRALLQMGGEGNAEKMVDTVVAVTDKTEWELFFDGQDFPFKFHGVEAYHNLLREAGLRAIRVELLPKDLTHENRDGLAGWIRTCWLPYTLRVPEESRERFVQAVVDEYLQAFPPDEDGRTHVAMRRLEVEAERP